MEEFVCADGRMSVNGVCYLAKTENQDDNIITTETKNNNINTEKFSNKVENITDNIKDSFEWTFDKIDDKRENFTTSIKNSVNSFNGYVEDKFGITNAGGKLVMGAALPTAVSLPFTFLQAIGSAQQAKKNEIQRIQNLTNQDNQGNINPVDMMTYNIPTAGQSGFNIHNDSYDQNKADGSGGYSGGYDSSTGNYNDPYSDDTE